MSLSDVNRYLHGQFAQVEGWCGPQLWQSIQPLVETMREAGPVGPVAEIGVYHGKFFIGLALTADSSLPSYAIDVYDLQQFNLDGAGKGDLERLKDNLAKSGLAEPQVVTYRANSMALGDSEIAEIYRRTGGFSFFSIDGCHMVEHTINDINVAMRLVAPGGIIFVDDYNNPHWPGVHEGVSKMYFMSSPRFVPLLYTCNKLFLCNISYHGLYFDQVWKFVTQRFPATRVKEVLRYGYRTMTILPDIDAADYLSLPEVEAAEAS